MKPIVAACLLAALAPASAGSEGAQDESLSGRPFALLLSLSASQLFFTPWPAGQTVALPAVSARFFGLFETSLLASYVPVDTGSFVFLGGEACLAPSIGPYFPSVGIGYFGYLFFGLWHEGNQGFYWALSPLRFSLENIADIRMPPMDGAGKMVILISFLELRYGPFIPWGFRWKLNTGNMHLQIDFVKAEIAL